MTSLQSALKAEVESERSVAMAVPCAWCGAPVGQRCFIPGTTVPLVKQPAHLRRLYDAGVYRRPCDVE